MPIDNLLGEQSNKKSSAVSYARFIKNSKRVNAAAIGYSSFYKSVKNTMGSIFRVCLEKLVLWGKIIDNYTHYTVCMSDNEEAVYIFRVCNDRVKGILCYDEMNIDKLNIIKIKDNEYLTCPKAHQVADKRDFEKHKAD